MADRSTSDDDDEALSWAGDRDLTHVDGRAIEPDPVDDGDADANADDEDAVDQDAAPRTSSLLLVVYGVLAGIYLLYTLGWITSLEFLPMVDLFSGIMYQFGQFLAIASPALWFAAAVVLTRERKPVVRLLWIVLGLVVVAPWPFLLGR
jgi:hypothetical protein